MDHLGSDILATLSFGGAAIFLMGFGFLFIDWILKKVDLQADIEKDNKSSAIFSSSIIIGIAVVVATVVNGVLR